jgi:hypothetical protein
MTPMIRRWTLWISAAVLAALAARVGAQTDSDSTRTFAYTEPERAYLGSPVRYVIVLQNLAEAEPPDIALDWAGVSYQGAGQYSSSSVRTVNGRAVRETVTQVQLQYTLTPERAGSFVVPAQTVMVGGQRYETNPVRLTVLEPEQAEGGSLTITLDDDEVWVGEPVRARIVWALPDVDGDVSNFEFTGPAPEGAAIEPRGSDVVRDRRRARELALWGKRAIGSVGTANIDGRPRTALTLEVDLLPDRSGDVLIDDLAVVFDVSSRFRGGTRRLMQTADPVTLRVRELPDEGRPDGFTGLVGRFGILSSAAPSAVNVGDPIDLFVTVTGTEPMRGVRTGPELIAQPGWEAFRMSPDGWRFEPGGSFGERVFKTIVRAGTEDVNEIPPVELAYFDPDAGTYRVARSDPIPLDVTAVREVTAADALVSGTAGPASGVVAREPLERAGAGIWANDLGPTVLAADAFSLAGAIRAPAFAALLVVPPGIWIGVTGWRAWRSGRDPGRSRRARARTCALRMVRRNGVGDGVRTYVADRFGMAPGAVTAADCRDRAEAINSDAGRELARLLARSEALERTGERIDRAEAAEAERLICRFDRDAAKGGV